MRVHHTKITLQNHTGGCEHLTENTMGNSTFQIKTIKTSLPSFYKSTHREHVFYFFEKGSLLPTFSIPLILLYSSKHWSSTKEHAFCFGDRPTEHYLFQYFSKLLQKFIVSLFQNSGSDALFLTNCMVFKWHQLFGLLKSKHYLPNFEIFFFDDERSQISNEGD